MLLFFLESRMIWDRYPYNFCNLQKKENLTEVEKMSTWQFATTRLVVYLLMLQYFKDVCRNKEVFIVLSSQIYESCYIKWFATDFNRIEKMITATFLDHVKIISDKYILFIYFCVGRKMDWFKKNQEHCYNQNENWKG